MVLPYRDRLALFGRYLQQLIMESLGKRLDRQGQEVLQGLAVYGNKGSTDQHAFIQQVRDGRDDTFVHFLETTQPGASSPADGALTPPITSCFRLGTESALTESGRPSLTIRVPDPTPAPLGALVALFERAVGLYAELVDINAYHQPGVEAGKRAARDTLSALTRVQDAVSDEPPDIRGDWGDGRRRPPDRLAPPRAPVRRGCVLCEVGDRPAADRFSAV